jgi:hypothetical protein
MARSHPFFAPDTSAKRPAKPTTLVTGLALLMGLGTAVVCRCLPSHLHRSEGFLRLSHRQGPAGNGDVLRLELPAGWWVWYNGHQAWRGGTVMDGSGRPRIEVWLYEGEAPHKEESETWDLPWGRVTCLTGKERMERPFHSVPFHKVGDGCVVVRAFLLDHGYLTFCVAADQDAELKSVIWQCMRSLQSGAEENGAK